MKHTDLTGMAQEAAVKSPDWQNESGRDEEIVHLQADGFWGGEKGFQDAEELRRQRQQPH